MKLTNEIKKSILKEHKDISRLIYFELIKEESDIDDVKIELIYLNNLRVMLGYRTTDIYKVKRDVRVWKY